MARSTHGIERPVKGAEARIGKSWYKRRGSRYFRWDPIAREWRFSPLDDVAAKKVERQRREGVKA